MFYSKFPSFTKLRTTNVDELSSIEIVANVTVSHFHVKVGKKELNEIKLLAKQETKCS